jgi:hypothetical protein
MTAQSCVFIWLGIYTSKSEVDGAVQAGVLCARLHWVKLGSDVAEHLRAYFGKTYRAGQLHHVLFRLV